MEKVENLNKNTSINISSSAEADINERTQHESPKEKTAGTIEFITPSSENAKDLAELEAICFPPNEACSPEMVEKRLRSMPELWLCAKDSSNGKTVGFICGYASSKERIVDEMFEDTALYEPEGKNIMILGVEVHPDYRGKGIAAGLMEEYKVRMKAMGKEKLVLTCHDRLIGFYERFGFEDMGISGSKWGGETWYDMELVL